MTSPLLISTYESARSELIERIRLRDQNLIAYLATVGAILGFTFQDGAVASKEIINLSVFSIPFICVVFSSIVINHHNLIGKIGEYIATELCEKK